MKEIEILRRAARSAAKMLRYKSKYDIAIKEYNQAHKYVRERFSDKNILNRAQKINPLYENYKEHRRQFEGWIFLWEQRAK